MANSARIAPDLARPIGPARAGFTNYQTPAEVAAKVFEAVRANRLYIITHAEYAPIIAARAAALASGTGQATPEALENVLRIEAEVLKMYEAAGSA